MKLKIFYLVKIYEYILNLMVGKGSLANILSISPRAEFDISSFNGVKLDMYFVSIMLRKKTEVKFWDYLKLDINKLIYFGNNALVIDLKSS
jgi:hypothetical protein